LAPLHLQSGPRGAVYENDAALGAGVSVRVEPEQAIGIEFPRAEHQRDVVTSLGKRQRALFLVLHEVKFA
jgi:hypothetical protein